jgi:steroid delta-isomerase-like uncharacterized protein
MTTTNGLRARRQAIVDEHLLAERELDFDRALKTFHDRPNYVMLGEEIDGEDAVRAMYTVLFASFPDFDYQVTKTYHSDDAVILYGNLTGTHGGPYMGIEATGREIKVPAVGIFNFEEDRLLNETVVFDNETLLRQVSGNG